MNTSLGRQIPCFKISVLSSVLQIWSAPFYLSFPKRPTDKLVSLKQTRMPTLKSFLALKIRQNFNSSGNKEKGVKSQMCDSTRLASLVHKTMPEREIKEQPMKGHWWLAFQCYAFGKKFCFVYKPSLHPARQLDSQTVSHGFPGSCRNQPGELLNPHKRLTILSNV